MRVGVVSGPGRDTELLHRAVSLAPQHQIVWTAHTAAEAGEACAREMPELILLDVSAAGHDAVDATRRIMTATPCAILIVARSVQACTGRVFDAMGWGAIDAVDLPDVHNGELADSATALLGKMTTIARRLGDTRPIPPPQSRPRLIVPRRRPLVAIGASAGGPRALAAVLSRLPKSFPAAVVAIQHVDERFAPGMASWLSETSGVPVVVAEEDQEPRSGTVLLAGTSDHLALKSSNRLGYTPEPRHAVYRPSVDVFFQSASDFWNGDVVGVLLTGMGSDGALGLKALRGRGHHTIAQDEATSAVYGMPKAALNLNAAVEVLPMERIAPRLIELCGAA